MDWFASWWKRGYCVFIGSTREILSVLCSAVVIELSFAFANQEGKKIVVDKWTDAPGNLFWQPGKPVFGTGSGRKFDATPLAPLTFPTTSTGASKQSFDTTGHVVGILRCSRIPKLWPEVHVVLTGFYEYSGRVELWWLIHMFKNSSVEETNWGMREGVDDIQCTMNLSFSQGGWHFKNIEVGGVVEWSNLPPFMKPLVCGINAANWGGYDKRDTVFGSRCKKGSALSQTWLQKVTAWEIYNTNLLLTSKRRTISQYYFFWSAALGKKPPMIRSLSGRTWSRTTSSAHGEQNDWCKT